MEAQPISPAEIENVTRELAELLAEAEEKPVQQIWHIVELCGADFARELYKAALETEEQGGLMLPDNSRRRTLGGVYFYLARQRVNDEQHKVIFPGYNRRNTDAPPPAPRLPNLNWDERVGIIEQLTPESGGINSVKVTLIGRPGKIEARHEVIVTTMSDVIKVPTLPKGVPPPPTTPTLYTVYIAAKQWRKVEEAMANPEDSLIVEGVAVYDPEIKGMAVFASNAQSKLMEIKRREEQKSATNATNPEATPKAKPAAPPALEKPPRSTRSRIADSLPPAPAAPTVSAPAGMPAEAAQKLSGLYASASLFRQKIANLKSKPEGQQGGLEMTQKLLKNVEDEIVALEKKYADK